MRKTLVLSIDSGCWEYLDPLMEDGRMPNVARLADGGVRGVLESTMPPITPVAFSSFITGTNPGKHGVFDWSVRYADGSREPASALSRRGVPFWHYLNQGGIRVGLFNIPVTYPPQPVAGFVVPGITVPENARNLTYPVDVLDQIEERYGPYHVDVPWSLLDESVEQYTSAWLDYEAMQTDAALMLMEAYGVDVLVFNYASLDRVNHFSPHRDQLDRVLINVDAQIGRFVDRYPEANVILMSDHGSRRIKNAFLLGKWLAGQGYAVYGEKSLDIPPYEINFVISRYLQAQGMNGVGERVVRGLLKGALSALPRAVRRPIWERMHRAAPQVLDYRFDERLDFVRTRVFATSNSGPLIINRNPPGQNGGIGDKEYEALRAALIRDLMAIKDPGTGEPVFSHVYRREEIYHGPAMARAPDLVVDHYSSACDLIEDRNPDWFWFVNRLNRFGDHVRDGLFVLSGPDFEQDPGSGYRASIMDLPATLLHLYDVSIPEDFDGQVLAGFLASDRPVQTQATGGLVGALTGDYSDAEREQMIERLRALGYL